MGNKQNYINLKIKENKIKQKQKLTKWYAKEPLKISSSPGIPFLSLLSYKKKELPIRELR